MENTVVKPKPANWLFYLGIGLTALAAGLLIFAIQDPELHQRRSGFFDEGGLHFFTMLFTGGYFVVVVIHSIIRHKWRIMRMERRLFLVCVFLFSISAFMLNLSMQVFSEFTFETKICIALLHFALFGLIFADRLPAILRYPIMLMSGAGTMLALYFTLVLLPSMPIGLFFFWFFGFSLHLVAPAVFLIVIIVETIRAKPSIGEWVTYTTGLMIPLVVTIVFMAQWSQIDRMVHDANATIITRPDNELPTWVLLSQRLPENKMTEKYLKSDLLFDQGLFEGGMFGLEAMGFSDGSKHDPLITLANTFFAEPELSRADRIKILEGRFDARHQAQRRLWRGDDLLTTEVLTDIRVFPDHRIAYLEKIITIRNTAGWENNQQEAAYTFYLPEGSVATSLSLWVNGVEEKSRLTTKGKADSAYVAIVGVERRDPALLHWQEGNRLTVTVFPCTPAEDRRFKIGITIPLKAQEDKLVLQNVYFEGPEISKALETTVLQFDEPAEADIPKKYELVDVDRYQYTGKYRPYWELKMPAGPISSESFSFNGKTFVASDIQTQGHPLMAEEVYLDLNKNWSKQEFEQIWQLVQDKKVFICRDGVRELTAANKDQILEIANKDNFSLFPFYELDLPARSLVITKSGDHSPNLSDLKASEFGKSLEAYLATEPVQPVLFNLSNQLNPYLKTLHEFRTFHAVSGSPADLQAALDAGSIEVNPYDTVTISIPVAGMQIKMDSTATKAGGPDHLMRLFAYNQIVSTIGADYFMADNFVTDEMIRTAEEAFVVSPVSSLVVLETVQDYERFGIDEKENSLQNASTSNSGAVPEPHEWALIILTALLIIGLYYREKLKLVI